MLSAVRIIGHKEWAGPRKSDPRHDMNWRRGRVARFASRSNNFPITGAIAGCYNRVLAGLNGATWGFFLGKPKGPAVTTWNKDGFWQEFANGVIYAHAGKAFAVWGDILRRWWALGAETSVGYPITDELSCPDTKGRFQEFAGKDKWRTAIYWSPTTGAQLVKGVIGETWGKNGWETGKLGYPVGEEHKAEDGIVQKFQRGSILFKGGTATVRTT